MPIRDGIRPAGIPLTGRSGPLPRGAEPFVRGGLRAGAEDAMLRGASLGPELADLLAAIVTVVTVIGLLSFWRPSTEWHFENEPAASERESYETPPLGRTLYAWSPFIIIVALFLIVQIPPIKAAVGAAQTAINFPTAEVSETTGAPTIPWPGLNENVVQQPPVVPEAAPYAATYSTNWLSAAGTIILIADIIALAFLRVGPGRALRIYGQCGSPANRAVGRQLSLVLLTAEAEGCRGLIADGSRRALLGPVEDAAQGRPLFGVEPEGPAFSRGAFGRLL